MTASRLPPAATDFATAAQFALERALAERPMTMMIVASTPEGIKLFPVPNCPATALGLHMMAAAVVDPSPPEDDEPTE